MLVLQIKGPYENNFCIVGSNKIQIKTTIFYELYFFNLNRTIWRSEKEILQNSNVHERYQILDIKGIIPVPAKPWC